VIPAAFDYVVAGSVEEAVRHLRENGEDAKLIAGGHSLLPLMKLRLAAPTLLVDIGRIPGLHGVSANGDVRIGALTTHSNVAKAGLGVVSEAASTIADPQVRNRGTLGGSLAHGDPASDMPAIVLALDGTIVAEGENEKREIPAGEFFVDYLMTALQPHEVVTEVRLPDPTGYGHGYQKFNRRQEDWAMVAVAALVKQDGGTVSDVRIGLTHMAGTPLRARAAEDALRGQPLNEETIAAASALAAEGTNPPGDLNASPDYKRHLAQVLCRRALQQAAGTAG
jgi:carbon-monoxide dehydrogenase medium subunit